MSPSSMSNHQCSVILQIIPFPLAQVENRLVAAFYSGRIKLEFTPMIREDEEDTKDPHILGFLEEQDYTDRILAELGEGKDDYSLWAQVTRVNRDLRMGAKGLRRAVLGY